MAWRSSGSTNKELIDNLYKNGLITSERVRDAMLKVDRAHYCPSPSFAYQDSPQSIGHSATISAPHMHAHAAESLLPFLHPDARILDIGSGSGYLTHVFAELVFPSSDPAAEAKARGRVVGLEHIGALRELGEGNMRRSERGKSLLASGKVEFVKGDGRKGWVEKGRGGDAEGDGDGAGEATGWDAIHVGAAAVEVHKALLDQLRSPGRIFIPVEDKYGEQNIWVIDKDKAGNVNRKKLYGVRYVPLTDAPKD